MRTAARRNCRVLNDLFMRGNKRGILLYILFYPGIWQYNMQSPINRIARASPTPHVVCQLRHWERRRRRCQHRRRGERWERRSRGSRRRRRWSEWTAHAGERPPHHGILRDVRGPHHATRALMMSGGLLVDTRPGAYTVGNHSSLGWNFRKHEIT